MNVYICCSVRNATENEKQRLEEYTTALEKEGHTVHLPHRDTDQDTYGYLICIQNAKAIDKADEIHLFYSPDSQGSHFDMGMAFMAGKPIRIIENGEVGPGKSFPRMFVEWNHFACQRGINSNYLINSDANINVLATLLQDVACNVPQPNESDNQ